MQMQRATPERHSYAPQTHEVTDPHDRIIEDIAYSERLDCSGTWRVIGDV
jgi:hypothetical protein